jgi:ribosomal protein S18 acetylase RimI-like enzyme
MKTKFFNNRKIKIRELSPKDLKRAKDFLNYMNSLIDEDAKINRNKKLTLKEEKEWIKTTLKEIKKKRKIVCLAEAEGKIVGICDIKMKDKRESHVGGLGISVRKEYRGIGIGKRLMKTTLNLAKRRLRPKIIRLSVFENNKIAQNLYKKFGFKKVAKIPKQIQYKGKLISEIIMILEL